MLTIDLESIPDRMGISRPLVDLFWILLQRK